MTDKTPTAPTEPLPGRWRTLMVLAAGVSMIVLDGTIVGVSLPIMIEDLHLDITDAQWVNSLYAVVFAALLLSAGRLGDRIGRRTTFLAGVLIFVTGSILAAVADASGPLILSRAVQGVGGALVLPSTLSSVNTIFRGKDRATAFGVWGAVMSGMAALGPLLGGALTEYLTWRWIFWVNVPLGLLIVVGILAWVPQTHGQAARRGIDVDGLLTSAIGFGAIVFALIEGSSLGWWHQSAPFTIAGWTWPRSWISPVPVLALVGVLFVTLFILWERHRARVQRDALLDLDVFRIPTFSWGNLAAMMVAIGEFALVLVLPLYLVNVVGLSTMRTGLVLAAMALGAFASGASARHLVSRLTAPGVVLVGLLLEMVGTGLLAVTVANRASTWLLASCLVIYGIGLGLASAQLTSTVLADVPTELSGQASATQSTVRQLGSALGSAIAGTVLASGLAARLPNVLAGLGIPETLRTQLADTTSRSAGATITQLREQGLHSPLGHQTGQVVDALGQGFAQSTATAVLVACGFLGLGLVAAIAVARSSRRPHAGDAIRSGADGTSR